MSVNDLSQKVTELPCRHEEEERERRKDAQEKRRLEVAERRRRQELEEEERLRREEEDARIRAMDSDDEDDGDSDYEDVEGEEEPEPEPEPELTEEERVARMGMRERIQYELAKIAEQEELTRVRIARENKKRELVRQIKEEMAKIRGLDADGVGAGGNNGPAQAQGEDLPGWVKMVQSAELKRAAASGVERSSEAEQEGQDAVKEALKAEGSSEGGHQSKRDVAKAVDTEADSKPAMTFEESVSALLDLIEEEKKPKTKPTLLSRKKDVGVRVNCNLKVVSDAKHKFEELSSGASQTSPGSQNQHVLEHEINGLNVQRARENLLRTQQQQQSAQDKAASKAEGVSKEGFRKKCSDIREATQLCRIKVHSKDLLIYVTFYLILNQLQHSTFGSF